MCRIDTYKRRNETCVETFGLLYHDNMKITRETLLEQGWKENELFKSYVIYEKTVTVDCSQDQNCLSSSQDFNLAISQYSNTLYRDWNVHVDNEIFESVASLDVSDFEQIDALLKLCCV